MMHLHNFIKMCLNAPEKWAVAAIQENESTQKPNVEKIYYHKC